MKIVKKMNTQTTQNRPTVAYVLTLITGILNFIIAVVILLVGRFFGLSDTYIPYSNLDDFYLLEKIIVGIGGWLLIASIILIIAAARLHSDPIKHFKWGAIILIFSILTASIFGIIGGILALAFKPTPIAKNRLCINCGRYMDEHLRFCPYCGWKPTTGTG